MEIFRPKSLLTGELSSAVCHGYDDFRSIEADLDLIIAGKELAPGRMKTYQIASMALNAHGGIICPSLEMMRYEAPTSFCEALLAPIRDIVEIGKRIGIKVAKRLGIVNVDAFMRHFACHFKLFFTAGWLASRGYSEYQLERVINAAIRCARSFLTWLIAALRQLENIAVVDDFRPIAIGGYASSFVYAVNRMEGMVVMRTEDSEARMFRISAKARVAWRVIRLLVECRSPDGVTPLFRNALQQFRSMDRNGDATATDLSDFGDYIHADPRGGFRLRPFRKDGYVKG